MKVGCWFSKDPLERCVYVCMCVKIFSPLRRRYKRNWKVWALRFSFPLGDYSLRIKKLVEKYSMCKWALLFENYFLSSPYIWYMSQKLAYTQRAHIQQEYKLYPQWEQRSLPLRDPWNDHLGQNPMVSSFRLARSGELSEVGSSGLGSKVLLVLKTYIPTWR